MCTDGKRSGSITVVLALTFTFITALLLTLLEYARVSGLSCMAKLAGDLAADSLMAGYNRSLFERYGLLLYDGSLGKSTVDYEGMEEEFGEYLKKNSGTGTFYEIGNEEIRVKETIGACDYNGEIFLQSVLDYYRPEGTAELIRKIEESLRLFRQGEEAKDKFEEEREQAGETEPQGEDKSGSPESQTGESLQEGKCEPLTEKTAIQTDISAGKLNTIRTWTGPEFETVPLITELSGKMLLIPLVLMLAAEEEPDPDCGNELLEAEKEARKGGWMYLVMPVGKTYSARRIDMTDAPSLCAADTETISEESALEKAEERIILNEYLLNTFSSFTENREGAVQYETEYILYGKDTDEKNLKAVLKRILWSREGVNLLYLTSSEKAEKCCEIASFMALLCGQEELVPFFQLALEAGWCYAESLLEVKMLLSGKKIAAVKTEESWNLSMGQAAAYLLGIRTSGKEVENGMDYRDFLRMFLYLQPIPELCLRAMDMIQLKMRQEQPGFLMMSQLYGVSVHVCFYAEPLFTALPVWSKSMGKRGTRYSWEACFSAVY